MDSNFITQIYELQEQLKEGEYFLVQLGDGLFFKVAIFTPTEVIFTEVCLN